MLSLSILVLFVGMYLERKIKFLRENFIPPAVTGGLLFAVGVALIRAVFQIELDFEMHFRDLLLLIFFSTVGLSARLSTLASGGKTLAILVVAAGVFLLFQNVVGIAVAKMFGAPTAYGLVAGSISFAGGHGTAIAWGNELEASGYRNAADIGLAFATFGLIFGGLLGGPIARHLFKNLDTKPDPSRGPTIDTSGDDAPIKPEEWLFRVLRALLLLALCVSLGDLVNRFLADLDILLPGFLTSMFTGIIFANTLDIMKQPLSKQVIGKFGTVALHIFLAMSMMTIQLWILGGMAFAIIVVLLLQIAFIGAYTIFIVFRLTGRDYDAVVITAGFVGMGLGATPVAIANMNAITETYASSTKAYIVIPLVGAFFIDLLNAGVIQFFLSLIS